MDNYPITVHYSDGTSKTVDGIINHLKDNEYKIDKWGDKVYRYCVLCGKCKYNENLWNSSIPFAGGQLMWFCNNINKPGEATILSSCWKKYLAHIRRDTTHVDYPEGFTH